MPKLNKIQRQTVINGLTGTYGQQFLLCDGYLICASIELYKQRLYITCYVDGKIKGNDMACFNESELDRMTDVQKKFMRPSKKARYNANFIKEHEKIMGKRWCKKNGMYEKRTLVVHYFNTPTSFVSHINKHCTDIEILTFDDYRARLDAKKEAEHAQAA